MPDRKCWRFYLWTIAFLIFTSGVYAQQAPAPVKDQEPCTIDKWNAGASQCELTILRVQNKQKDVQMAFAAYQDAMQKLSQESERTKNVNHWDEAALFDIQNGKFIMPPAKTESPEREPKAAPPKKN